MITTKPSVFRFSDVTVREREFSVLIAGQVHPVEPKAFQVLLILIRNPNKLITKEELLNSVWADAAVTENSLARNIALLRRLLGDDARAPRYIETVTSLGYRWLCPVELVQDPAAVATIQEPAVAIIAGAIAIPETEAKPRTKGKHRWIWMSAGAIAAVVLLTAGIPYLRGPLPPPRITAYTQITRDGRGKGLAATDGNRLYFTQGSGFSIEQIGINGGEVAPLPIKLPGEHLEISAIALKDISPDASNALICTAADGESLWMIPLLGGAARRLDDGEGAAFSPDGGAVIYWKAGDIYTISSDGTGKRKLATVGSLAEAFSGSPDGKTIRFSRDGHLWEMSADGSGIHRLLPNWKGPEFECCGKWTPDGSFYVFLAGKPTEQLANFRIWALDERHELFRKPATDPIQLTSEPMRWSQPIPSRDSKRLFAEGYIQRGELTRIDPKTGNPQPFLDGISAEFVAFSADGNLIAYVSYPDGILWRVNRDGSNRMQLTHAPGYVMSPRFSPDGKQIVFMWLRDGHYSMRRISAADGSPQWLISDDTAFLHAPTWSPDGKKILFGWMGSEKRDLRIVDLETQQVTILPDTDRMWGPGWSSDGRYILALFNLTKESDELRIFDFSTRRWRTLSASYTGFPSFSRDSRWIYFFRPGHDYRVFRIPVAGGKEKLVADLPNWHGTGYWGVWMNLDPTDDAPLLLRDAGMDDIFALTLEQR